MSDEPNRHNEFYLVQTIKALTDLITHLTVMPIPYQASLQEQIPQDNVNNDKVFRICVEEYKALRAEQQKRLEIADRNLHYLVIIIAATLGATISLFSSTNFSITNGQQLITTIILLIPPLATPLIFVALNNEIMIIRLGVYLYDILRPVVANIAKYHDAWIWERYHVKQSRNFLFKLSSSLRRLAFIIPSLTPIIVFIITKSQAYTTLEISLLIMDITLAACTIIMLIYVLAIFGRAAQE